MPRIPKLSSKSSSGILEPFCLGQRLPDLLLWLIEAEWCIYASVQLPSSFHIMTCRLVGAKPLYKPLLDIINRSLRNQRIFNRNPNISLKKMYIKMTSAKWQLFCLGLNVLTDIVPEMHERASMDTMFIPTHLLLLGFIQQILLLRVLLVILNRGSMVTFDKFFPSMIQPYRRIPITTRRGEVNSLPDMPSTNNNLWATLAPRRYFQQ